MALLAELDVLVVDLQATGASPSFGRVLELGWAVVRAGAPEVGQAQAHWILLPEGYVVPREVRRLTGYEPEFSSTAIGDREAWQRLRSAVEASAPVPTAIHYARFELAFLREWAARFEPEAPFPLDPVCVHAIAVRLYPELPRQSIRALAGFLGHSLHLERRALGHVEATAFVWRRLCAELAGRGVLSWEDLRAFLAERAPRKPRAAKPKYPIETQRYRSLPDRPGVYRFLRSNGDVLYVGKAASLKRRAASHFVGRAGTAQSPEMLTQVSDIAVTVVESALEAALLENETIKALRPPYNVQLTAGGAPVWYGTRGFEAAATAPDREHPIGPVPSEHSLLPLAAVVSLAGGAEPSAWLRSHAVGVSALFTPDDVVFAAGWAELCARHPELARGGAGPRRSVFALARRLTVSAAPPPAEEAAEATTRAWDPPRVARHVEEALVQAYRAYRRASFLSLLHESDVVFREPAAEKARLLRIRNGRVCEACDAPPAHVPERRLVLARPPAVDRATYDRLRILTTELKRIQRDGGEVAVHWGPRRRLPARLLPGVLAVV